MHGLYGTLVSNLVANRLTTQNFIMQRTHLTDYQPPNFLIPEVELEFELNPASTVVRSRSTVERSTTGNGEALRLDGEHLELNELQIDDHVLSNNDYRFIDSQLLIPDVPDHFTLQVENTIRPKNNTTFSGLYMSGNILCTQCEAEGFRRITYWPDRPDILSRYTVKIVSDQNDFPVLLSNGELQEEGLLPDNRHFTVWQDPFPKPCYLFALVAGKLSVLHDEFITRSGKNVALQFYAPEQDLHKCGHGMDCLKNAMRWDEEVYGREYDMNRYMLVAVDEFNMGAMENKGLNIFNSKYVYAKPESATDQDYEAIESVIAHEYFHNWSGNRVTLRDWFQLSLKEGFTIFRDQQFSSDMGSADVKRIYDANMIKIHQFREDEGPNAHPVQPDSYLTIDNFYTLTVYNKGAELIRMMRILLGPETFRCGTDLYFEQNDGQAVTIEEFVAALETASGVDLQQFRRWYKRSGTPTLKIERTYDAVKKTYTITVEQKSAGSDESGTAFTALHVPIAVALLGQNGNKIPLHLQPGSDSVGQETLLELKQNRESFVFHNVNELPVPSLLRGFSAPVKTEVDLADEELYFIVAHDDDACSRWDAMQRIAIKQIQKLIQSEGNNTPAGVDEQFTGAFQSVLLAKIDDLEYKALLLTLPSELSVAQTMDVVDPAAIHKARKQLVSTLASQFTSELTDLYQQPVPKRKSAYDSKVAGARSLRNLCLGYLNQNNNSQAWDLAYRQFTSSSNMTDEIAALGAIVNSDSEQKSNALDSFYTKWRQDSLVIDKWFRIQATASRDDTLSVVEQLTQHESFTINVPNRVYALIGGFCGANPYCFHNPDGSGYDLLTNSVLELDSSNPQLAARLATTFSDIRKLYPQLRATMLERLNRIATRPLSVNLSEIIEKTLNTADATAE